MDMGNEVTVEIGSTGQRKMRAAVVAQPWESYRPPAEGGSLQIWTYQVTRRLTGQCDFIVYSRGQKKEVRQIGGIEYRYVPTRVAFKLQNKLSNVRWLLMGHKKRIRRPQFSRSFSYLRYAIAVARDLRKRKCDVVHILNFSQFAPVIRRFNPDIKIILNMQCEWLSQLDPNMIRRRLQHVDMIIGCSNHITSKIQAALPEFANRCRTVYNGVTLDPDMLSGKTVLKERGEGVVRLLFVGRVSPEKGVHVAVDAMALLVKKYPNVRFDIVGPVGIAPFDYLVALSDEPKVRALSRFYNHVSPGRNYTAQMKAVIEPDLTNVVSLVGNVPHSKLREYYEKADVYVAASLSDAFPLPVVEAMGYGLPVVGSAIGGIPEAVEDGVTGLLVPSDDPEALAAALGRVVESEQLRQQMGAAGRKRAFETFLYDKIAADTLECYREVVGWAVPVESFTVEA
jgi:glycosyltransferase involved in cell wall biosynthesis